ncbi:MAG: hypothetical protein D6766_11445 [Verrucomicrobia bacterium]|nr:MAG: hypothetical protein D6766_11445 [Verrucomicrobiota bacterium]
MTRSRSQGWWVWLVAAVPVAVAGVWLLAVLSAATGYPWPEPWRDRSQPVAYSHQKHLALHMECTACHFGAETGTHAGLPPTSFCASCHLLIPPPGSAAEADTNAVAAAAAGGTNRWAAPTPPELARYLKAGEEIPWKQFQRAPRHVFFSHRRHVTIAHLDCAVCHGDMNRRDQPVTRAEFPTHLPGMNRCVDCHLKEKVSTDCLACHH